MIDSFFRAIEEAGLAAAAGGLTAGAERIAIRAKEKAPVRKVFGDKGEKIRIKTIEEIESDRSVRRQLGLGPERTHLLPPTIVSKAVPQRLSLRGVVPGTKRLATPGAFRQLDRRGRYELRVGRSIHKDQLGGRLRDEIHATAATIGDRLIVARVVSPTPYAKFQEFGTRHHPAHPYLRSSAYELSSVVKAEIAGRVTAAAQQAVGSIRIDVTTKLRVVA